MTRKEKLEELTNGDVVSIVYGFDRKVVVITGNNKEIISWRFVWESGDSITTNDYSKMVSRGWSHVGYMQKRFFLPNKLILFQ